MRALLLLDLLRTALVRKRVDDNIVDEALKPIHDDTDDNIMHNARNCFIVRLLGGPVGVGLTLLYDVDILIVQSPDLYLQ